MNNFTMKTMKRRFTFMLAALLLTACCFAPMGMMGQEKATAATYKLVKVNTVSSGNMYVFEQNGHVFSNFISSSSPQNALATTTSYQNSGLTGSEAYVYSLVTASGGFYMKNNNGYYLTCKKSGTTDLKFNASKENLGIWKFTFANFVATITAVKNNGRYLAYSGSSSYTFKAYASSDDSEITVYKLVEETPTCTASPTSLAFGDVEVNHSSQKTLTLTTSDLTGALSLSVPAGYTVSPTTIAKTATSTTVTVTCSPTTLGAMNGTLTISGGGLSSNTTVALTATGVCTSPATPLAFDPISLPMEDEDVSTILAPISGTGNGGDITYTLTTNPEGNGEVDGDTFYAIGTGTYVVTATQAANGIYCGASVDITIDVLSTDPLCVITPDTYDFGNVAIGSTNTATFTVNTENLEGNLTVSIDHTADGFSVSPTSIASTATTTTLTVTFAPAAATADLTATLTISGGGLEDDVEALVSGKAVQSYTVTFNCNGGMATAPAQQSVLSGASVTLPNAGNLNSDFTFVGWTIDPDYVDDEDIFHVGESVTVTGDETYYAVYSHSVFQPTGEKYYELVDEDLNDWSGRYIIVYDMDVVNYNTVYAFNGGRATLDSNFNYVEIDKENDKIEADETANSIAFTVAAKSGGYSIKSASGYYIGVTSYDNGLAQSETDDFVNAFSYGSSNVDITVAVGNNYCTLRFNNSSSTMRFRYYKTGQKAIQLYKYTEAGTTTTARYTRVFLNETATDDIEIVGPSIIPSGYSLDMDEFELVNDYDDEMTGDLERAAANLVIEEGAQLFHNEYDVPATMQKTITAYSAEKDNYYLMALPFDSYSVEGSPLVTVNGNYDLYNFDGSETQEEWQQVGTDGAFDPTVGFLYANNEGGTLNLTGTLVPSNEPYDAYLNYDDTKTYGAWNLVGNPFACNATISVSNYYVIDGEELTATTGVIAPLQGVMVQATEPSQHIVFTKAAGAKSAQAIKVNVYKENASKGAAVVDRAIVRFDESQGLVKFQLNPSHTKVYFTQDNKEYAVVHSGSEAEMPVSFKAEKSGSYTFNVETENVEMDYLHLIDNMTGADVDLLQTPSYTFEASSSDYESRFRLVFNATGIEENDTEANATFAYYNGNEWVVNNSGNATLQVVDMMGRVLSSETLNGNANVILNQAAGIYMLRLVNGENVKVQKVVVR